MKHILIADDHPLMRGGTRQIVVGFIPDAKITEADSFKKAILAAEKESFHLVIMDIGMPGGNSVKMVETFKRRWPDTKILMLSGFEETLYALPFVKAGADGYISKDAPESEFRTALETVLFRSKLYLSESLKEESFRMFMQSGKSHEDTSEKLSLREREIVQLLLAGKGISEIASLLDIHTSTASTHRIRIFRKLGVDNVMDLARIYNILK
ncbi:response regulator transcription factor [Dyadobacter aurulentus]|uniref:response regulator transcription factor n=1 Tax=Dyadobacter sp. UC 10 TaxID=2605428 RepID=UPI0011F279CA|nr:response regulator transcription factor [Dyadobacter sp. UC 10]KAA0993502.1 response regulator transcription factor [Dyadobacter sp. UC 10]